MKTYRLEFKCDSYYTQLPNANTIFGFICNTIKNFWGEDELEKYIKSFDSNPYFIHSSMFVKDNLPMIPINIIDKKTIRQNYVDSSDKLYSINNAKKINKISYISEDFILHELNKNDIFTFCNRYKKINKFISNDGSRLQCGDKEITETYMSNLHTQNLIRNGFPIDNEKNEKSLFYTNLSKVKESLNIKDNFRFVIYIKTDNNIEEITKIFKYMQYIGIGKRRSVGLNIFEYCGWEEIDEITHNNDYREILSSYIPMDMQSIDIEKSFYNIEKINYICSKEIMSEIKYQEIFQFREGSYLKLNEENNDIEYLGKVFSIGKQDNIEIYRYGIGFIL